MNVPTGSLGVSKTFTGESREGVRSTFTAPVGEHFLLMMVSSKKFEELPPTHTEIGAIFNRLGWYDEETLYNHFGREKMQEYVDQLPILRRG